MSDGCFEIEKCLGDNPEMVTVAAPRPVTSFFSSLTAEQRAAALAHDGPDEFGNPAFLRRAEKDYGI